MKKRDHQDRLALIERLEKKYSEKTRFHWIHKQQRFEQESLRTIRGIHITDDYLDYEAIDATIKGGRRLAY
jgi:hypothetical protein